MKKKALILAGAPINHFEKEELRHEIENYSFVVAADSGLDFCFEIGVLPDLAVGDFDSSKRVQDLEKSRALFFSRDKDLTDLEIAINEVEKRGFEEIFIYGGLGGLSRHGLTNLILAARHPLKIFFLTDNEFVFAVNRPIQLNVQKGQLISLLPLLSKPTVTTKNLKWEIENRILDSHFFSVSNECLREEVSLWIEEGCFICLLEKFKGSELKFKFIDKV
ncbi:thiamine diphosphokinase [Criblamydia sequanensis]|uniref:Thiamine diphosphokinase n=1 Tax=Candidatus Criblamydia sequanensis CRIB-18 TaxID=1437425 RepID=A0A090D048_9BACT|nr:thiamine diphosphokinase [Criblamydia sequanensis]CDR34661.1 Thiamine pyrophosphokinase [Criblamydia sequanensis CRIB-18]